MQGIRRACRHDIRFSSILDSLFGVTYNKSYIEKLNIQRNVLEVVEYLINLFVRQVSKHVKKHEESSSSESDKAAPPKSTAATTAPAAAAPAPAPASKSVHPKGVLLAHEKVEAPPAAAHVAPATGSSVPVAAVQPKNELKMEPSETKEQQALKKFGISIDLLSNNQIKIYIDGKTNTIPGTALERDVMLRYVSKKPSKEEAKTKIAEFVAAFTN
jgi:hypothetical protein